MLTPCNPCICYGSNCYQCIFGHKSVEEKHEEMKRLIKLENSRMKPNGYVLAQRYKGIHTDWETQMNEEIGRLAMEVRETEDEFIFATISNFIENKCNIAISKTELIQSIELFRLYKKYGYDISERFSTASAQSAALSNEYRRGLQDGISQEHDRIIGILDNLKEKKDEQNNKN